MKHSLISLLILFATVTFLSQCDSFITGSGEQDELIITVLQQEVTGESQFHRVMKERITLTSQNVLEFTKYDAVKVNVDNKNLLIRPTADSQKDLDANNITAVMYFLTYSYSTRGLYIRKDNYETMPDFSQDEGTFAMFPFFITENVPEDLTFVEFELQYITGTGETIDTMRIYMSRAKILAGDALIQKNADELNITYNTNPDHNWLFFNSHSEFDYALVAPVAFCWLNTTEGTFMKTEIRPGITSADLTSSLAFNSYEFDHIDFFALGFKDDVWE